MTVDNSKNINNNILEVITETIVDFIYEGLEIMKPEHIQSANTAIQDLYTQFLRDFKKNRKNIFMSIHVHTTWRGMHVYLTVNNSEFKVTDKPQYRGYYSTRRGGGIDITSITVTVNYATMQDYPTFREILFHEMTHHLDDVNHGTVSAGEGSTYVLNYIADSSTVVGDIIYRLWIPTERNAYSTKVLDTTPERYKSYIEELRNKIERIATYEPTENTEGFWKLIGKQLFKNQIKPNTPWTTIRNLFVKRSRDLLAKFEKKCQQRFGQHYGNQELAPDMKKLQFQGNHYDDLKKAKEWAYNYVMFKKPYQEYVDCLKNNNVKLSNKVMTQLYQEELHHLINLFNKEKDNMYADIVDWAKSQLK